MKKNIRKEKAITLIALVVTIVVLLILAGISLTALTGENRIIGKAKNVKTISDREDVVQQARIAVIAKVVEKRGKKIPEREIREVLNNHFLGIDSIEDLRDQSCLNETVHTREGNYEVKLSEVLSGVKIADKTIIRVNGTNIKTVDDLTTLYGEDTDFESVEGITWQLFLDDDTNIYLIAKDCVKKTAISDAPELSLYEYTYNGEARVEFARSYNGEDKGSIIENEPWCNGANSSSIINNTLTSKYLKYAQFARENNYNNPNMMVVAYMMDTTKWRNFAGNIEGATAIGGPTLEMFVLSYNAKHETKFGTYDVVNSTNADQKGYKLKIGNGNWSNISSVYGQGIDLNSDNMWFRSLRSILVSFSIKLFKRLY